MIGLKKSYESVQGKKQRLFLFDYDGTLTPIVDKPEDAKINFEMCNVLYDLALDRSNVVWIISGRDRTFLDSIFPGKSGIGLCAEHGAYSKPPNEATWKSRAEGKNMDWKEVIVNALQQFNFQNPGAVIERKDATITWHYRNVDLPTDDLDALGEECYEELASTAAKLGDVEDAVALKVMKGKMNVEVKMVGIDKGAIAQELIGALKPAFVFAAGDDTTDEDMFKVMGDGESNWSVFVGPADSPSLARFRIENPAELCGALKCMATL